MLAPTKELINLDAGDKHDNARQRPVDVDGGTGYRGQLGGHSEGYPVSPAGGSKPLFFLFSNDSGAQFCYGLENSPVPFSAGPENSIGSSGAGTVHGRPSDQQTMELSRCSSLKPATYGTTTGRLLTRLSVLK